MKGEFNTNTSSIEFQVPELDESFLGSIGVNVCLNGQQFISHGMASFTFVRELTPVEPPPPSAGKKR